MAPFVALTAVPIILAAGSAIDYSRASRARAELQAALDAAVLAGAKDPSSNAVATALTFFNGNSQIQGATVNPPTFTINADGSISGSASATVPTTFMQIAQIQSVTVTAASRAVKAGYPPCILALVASGMWLEFRAARSSAR